MKSLIFLIKNDPSTVFVLKGHAELGKKYWAFGEEFTRMGYRSVLMAPTGRAAKVMGGHG